mgnify:CR=1 FL=1
MQRHEAGVKVSSQRSEWLVSGYRNAYHALKPTLPRAYGSHLE